MLRQKAHCSYEPNVGFPSGVGVVVAGGGVGVVVVVVGDDCLIDCGLLLSQQDDATEVLATVVRLMRSDATGC